MTFLPEGSDRYGPLPWPSLPSIDPPDQMIAVQPAAKCRLAAVARWAAPAAGSWRAGELVRVGTESSFLVSA